MAKPTIVTRAGKGAALSWTEGDANVTNLQNATVTLKAGTAGTDVVSDLNGTVTIVAGTNISLSGDNSAKTLTITNTASSGIASVSADATPSLGGNLNVAGYSIVSTSSGNITLAPNNSGNIFLTPNTGYIKLAAVKWPAGAGTANYVLQTNGTDQLSWTALPSAGATNLDGLSDVTITGSPSSGQIIRWSVSTSQWTNQAAGYLSSIGEDASPMLGGNLNVSGYSITSISNGNIAITPNGSGDLILDGQKWPQADGTSNQVLKTNGAGQLSWTTVSSGASALTDLSDVQITTPSTGQVLTYSSASSKWVNQSGGITGVYQDAAPSLGGNLTVMGYSIVSVANGNISITPNGSGDLILDGLKWPQADGTANQVLKTNGSGQLSWTTAGGGGSQVIVIGTSSNGDTSLTMPATAGNTTTTFAVLDSASVSGVSATTGYFTLPAGTYVMRFPTTQWESYAGTSNLVLRNITAGSNIHTISYDSWKNESNSTIYGQIRGWRVYFTLSESSQITFRSDDNDSGGWYVSSSGNRWMCEFQKIS